MPYLRESLLQIGAVLGFLTLAIALRLILGSLQLTRISVIFAALAALCYQQTKPFVASNPIFNMAPRVAYCGSMGCVTNSDRAVVDFVSTFGREILSRHPYLSYQTAPKIMILGDMATLGIEEWVFPHGASRILPLESPLPVAFFYGRGSSSWSYHNYRSKVCLDFDLDWLKRRNVRYLFIPSTRRGCLRGKERVLGQAKVIFQDGDARFFELF